jgi:hypothetical protein
VHLVGSGAVEALDLCRSSGGRVAGHYRHVLIVEAGPRLLAVQDRSAARSPFSLVLGQAFPPAWPADGTRVTADAGLLRMGALVVRLRVGPDQRWASEGVVAPRRQVDAVREGLPATRAAPGPGWAAAILAPYVAASAFGSDGCNGVQRLVRARGSAALGALARGDSCRAMEAAAERLCGLGVGATPSGDDALVGFLGAWLRLAPISAREPARQVAAWLAQIAPGRTSRLAAEFYYHLARERLSDPVEHVLSALASGEPAMVTSAAARLAHYGASSGCDTLAGVDAYLRRPSRP